MPTSDWFEILVHCRTISSAKLNFTASDLALEAGFEDTDKKIVTNLSGTEAKETKGSKKAQIASAWLAKFVKWKYAVVAGKIQTGAPRQSNLYELTKLGKECIRRDQKSQEKTKDEAEADHGNAQEQAGLPAQQEALKLSIATLTDAIYEFATKRGTKDEENAFQALLVLVEELRPPE